MSPEIISSAVTKHNALLCVLATARLHGVREVIPDLLDRVDAAASTLTKAEEDYREVLKKRRKLVG